MDVRTTSITRACFVLASKRASLTRAWNRFYPMEFCQMQLRCCCARYRRKSQFVEASITFYLILRLFTCQVKYRQTVMQTSFSCAWLVNTIQSHLIVSLTLIIAEYSMSSICAQSNFGFAQIMCVQNSAMPDLLFRSKFCHKSSDQAFYCLLFPRSISFYLHQCFLMSSRSFYTVATVQWDAKR